METNTTIQTKPLKHPNYGIDARTENFEIVTVLEQTMLFTCLRVNRNTVPEGMYVYDVRHDDDQQGIPVQIGDFVLVNHWGTLLSNRPIQWDEITATGRAYRYLNPDKDWNYEGYVISLQEYLEKHPIEEEPASKAAHGGLSATQNHN